MTHSEIKQALEWRYATKRFDATKKISEADWKILEDSLKMAPSSYGVQPWKFLVVQNPALREKLKEVSWNQTQVTDSSHYVVLLYKEQMDAPHVQKYIDRIAQVRGVSEQSLDGYKQMMLQNLVVNANPKKMENWAQRQSYIAMGFLLETAALLKIDACPMEGFDPAAYDKLLELEGSGWKTIATVALGYRHDEDAYQTNKKVRFEDEHLIKFIR